MTNKAILEFDGSFIDGFRVTLVVESDASSRRKKANLPAANELLQQLKSHWDEKYRPLGEAYRRALPEHLLDFRIKVQGVSILKPRAEAIQDCHQSGVELSQALNDWLTSDSFRVIDQVLREEFSPRDAIQIILHTNSFYLKKLPWSEWNFLKRYPYAVVSFAPLESSTNTTSTTTLTPPGTIRILAILGDKSQIDLSRDREIIQNLSHVEAIFLEQPSHEAIIDRLWNESWDILFFAGHSETLDETTIIYINSQEYIKIDQLWHTLRKAVAKGLQLAIFNSCDALGLSQKLDDIQIPQMILMRELLPDEVAHQFLTYFLTRFASGMSLYQSVREAQEQLHDKLDANFPCASWLPVICQNPLVLPPSWEDLVGEVAEPVPIAVSRPSPRRRSWRWHLAVSLLVATAVIFVRSFGWLQPLELKAYGWMLRQAPTEDYGNRVVLVDITQDDYEYYQFEDARQGSINDEKLYELLQNLDSYQPAAIAIALLRDRPDDIKSPKLRSYLENPNNDHIYGICYAGNTVSDDDAPSPYISDARIGFDNLINDKDGTIRRQLLAMGQESDKRDCETNQSIELKLTARYIKSYAPSKSLWAADHSKDIYFGNMKLPRLEANPGAYQSKDTDLKGLQLMFKPYNNGLSQGVRRFELVDLLDKKNISDSDLRDRIVFVGTSREGSKLQLTPYGSITTAALHAQMTSQIIDHIIDGRPLIITLSSLIEIMWIAIWTTAVSYLLRYRYSSLTFTLAAIIFTIICITILHQGIWVPFVPAILGIGIVYTIHRSKKYA